MFNIWIGLITVHQFLLRNSWITFTTHRVYIRVSILWWYIVRLESAGQAPLSYSMLLSIPFVWEKE